MLFTSSLVRFMLLASLRMRCTSICGGVVAFRLEYAPMLHPLPWPCNQVVASVNSRTMRENTHRSPLEQQLGQIGAVLYCLVDKAAHAVSVVAPLTAAARFGGLAKLQEWRWGRGDYRVFVTHLENPRSRTSEHFETSTLTRRSVVPCDLPFPGSKDCKFVVAS